MNLREFYQLDEMEQVEAIWDADKIAEQPSEPGYRLELYLYRGLFLEVKINLETKWFVYIKPITEGWN